MNTVCGIGSGEIYYYGPKGLKAILYVFTYIDNGKMVVDTAGMQYIAYSWEEGYRFIKDFNDYLDTNGQISIADILSMVGNTPTASQYHIGWTSNTGVEIFEAHIDPRNPNMVGCVVELPIAINLGK